MEGKGEGEKETFPCVSLRVAHAAMEKERCPIRGDREHFVAKETPISLFARSFRAVPLLFSILGSIVVRAVMLS